MTMIDEKSVVNSTLLYLLQTSNTQVKAANNFQELAQSYLQTKRITPSELQQLFTYYMTHLPAFKAMTIQLHEETIALLTDEKEMMYELPSHFFEQVNTKPEWLANVFAEVTALTTSLKGQTIWQKEVLPMSEQTTFDQLRLAIKNLYKNSDNNVRHQLKPLLGELLAIECAYEEEEDWQTALLQMQDTLYELDLDTKESLKMQVRLLKMITYIIRENDSIS